MGVVVRTYVVTHNISINIVRLWAFKIIKMIPTPTILIVPNYLADKFNIKMRIFIRKNDTKVYAEWESEFESDGAELPDIKDAIYWLEMKVGSKISDILKSEINKGKAAAYQLGIIDTDGFLI